MTTLSLRPARSAERPVVPRLRRTLRILVCAATIGVLAVEGVAAQCALKVSPRPGETGYRKRNYACEGLYVQLQAATINVQVISLVKGKLDLPTSLDAALIHIPARLPGLRDTVAVFGRGREANLNWALDGVAAPGKPMIWHLDAVIHAVPIDAARLGVFGETRRTSGLGGPIYVPVAVTESGESPPQPEPGSRPDAVELVVRIPAAGAVQYRLEGGQWMPTPPQRPDNGDGYFVIGLHPTRAGPIDLEVRWRPSGSAQFGAPESLNILFW